MQSTVIEIREPWKGNGEGRDMKGIVRGDGYTVVCAY